MPAMAAASLRELLMNLKRPLPLGPGRYFWMAGGGVIWPMIPAGRILKIFLELRVENVKAGKDFYNLNNKI